MSLEQEGFQFFSDDGSQAVATALASQDTGISSAVDTSFRLRTLINSTATVPSRSAFRLEYKESAAPDYSPVSSSGGAIIWALSTNIASSGEATTQRLGTPSGKVAADFVTGRIWDDENGTDTISSMASAQNFTELEWCLQAAGSYASAAQVYSFRVTQFPYTSSPVAQDTFVGAISTGGGVTTTSTGAFSVGAGVNRALIAVLMNEDDRLASSVSYASGSGGAWAQGPSGAFNNSPRRFEIWYSTAPATGSTNITVTWNGALTTADGVIGCYSLNGVDQSTPLSGITGIASSTVTGSTTLTSGGMVVCGLLSNGDPGSITTGVENFDSASFSIANIGSNTASGTVAWTTSANGRGMIIGNVRQA